MTERIPLTDKLVSKLEAPPKGKTRFIYCGHAKSPAGFGIYLTSNVRSFFLTYTVKATGIQRTVTIGRFPSWNCQQARIRASELRRQVDVGGDPKAEDRAEKSAPTVTDLATRYLVEHAEKKKRASSVKEDRSLINQFVLPELGTLRVVDVRRRDVEAVFRKITDANGTPCRANSLLVLLSKMFNLAIGWELRSDNPVKGIEKNPEPKRERYLSADELAALMKALNEHPNVEMSNIIKLLILTGSRRSEVVNMHWDHQNLRDGIWTKPAAFVKQAKTHIIPLSAPARELLAKIRSEVDSAPERARELEREAVSASNRHHREALIHAAERLKMRFSSALVFPGYYGNEGPVNELAKSWHQICRRAGLGAMVQKKNAKGEVVLDDKGEPVYVFEHNCRLHDLRHSFASILASGGASLLMIGRLLGHASLSQVTERYSHLALDPLRESVERVGAIITAATTGKPGAEIKQFPSAGR